MSGLRKAQLQNIFLPPRPFHIHFNTIKTESFSAFLSASLQQSDELPKNLAGRRSIFKSSTSSLSNMRASRSTSQSKPTEASFAPCECHVFNIDDWPDEKGPIRVATCMHICPYCGDDLRDSYSLAVHLQTSNYLERGLVLNWIPMKESELQ